MMYHQDGDLIIRDMESADACLCADDEDPALDLSKKLIPAE